MSPDQVELIVVVAVLTIIPAAYLISRRKYLRPWHVWLPLVLLLLTGPISFRFYDDLRTQAGGEGAAWGRMAELIFLLATAPVAYVSAVWLFTALLLAAGNGFSTQEMPRRTQKSADEASWYGVLFRPRTPREYFLRFVVSMVALGFGIAIKLLF